MEMVEQIENLLIVNDEPEFSVSDDTKVSAEFFILCEENAETDLSKDVFDCKLCGMSILNWVVRACLNQPKVLRVQVGTDALDAIGQSIDGIDSTLTSIDTNVASSTGILGQIRNGVQSLVNTVTGTIANTLSGILTEVQALVDEIVLSTETFVAGILNTIPTAFQTVWDTMKNAFSIWHYVVEWFTSISGPFTWIWGIASGTSYYIILPVYASLAGAVVLAFYKRFGK